MYKILYINIYITVDTHKFTKEYSNLSWTKSTKLVILIVYISILMKLSAVGGLWDLKTNLINWVPFKYTILGKL